MRSARFAAVAVILLFLPSGGEHAVGMMTRDEDFITRDKAAKKADASKGSKPPRTVGIGRADPFAPLVKRAAVKASPLEVRDGIGGVKEPGPVRLEGIIWSSKRPHAVINETLVSVGDVVAGWTVVGIDREEVILLCGGLRMSLNMGAHIDSEEKKLDRPKEKGDDP
jgi:hypothetical protein